MAAEVLAPMEPPTAGSTSGRRGPLSPLVRYMLVRAALIIPMLWVLVTLVFLLMRVIGDPVTAAQGGRLNAQQIAERKHAAGLDRPMLTQYWEYIRGLIHGDFGTTLTDHREISGILTHYGAATLELSIWALLVAFTVGIPLGRLAARYRDQMPDVVLRLLAILFYAAPVFFVARPWLPPPAVWHWAPPSLPSRRGWSRWHRSRAASACNAGVVSPWWMTPTTPAWSPCWRASMP